jgi:hypothetical protein
MLTDAELLIAADAAARWPKGLHGTYLGVKVDGNGAARIEEVAPGKGWPAVEVVRSRYPEGLDAVGDSELNEVIDDLNELYRDLVSDMSADYWMDLPDAASDLANLFQRGVEVRA